MELLRSFGISTSGMKAERFRMDVISTNIANASTIRTKTQEAYKKRFVQLAEESDGRVAIGGTAQDSSPLRIEIEPANPYADAQGRVFHSNVDTVTEMVDMISASRAYEANLNAFNMTKQMLNSVLDIGRV